MKTHLHISHNVLTPVVKARYAVHIINSVVHIHTHYYHYTNLNITLKHSIIKAPTSYSQKYVCDFKLSIIVHNEEAKMFQTGP